MKSKAALKAKVMLNSPATNPDPSLAHRLGYAGLLPFIIALLMHVLQIRLLGEPERLFVSYSVVIASFLCGTLWRSAHTVEATKAPVMLWFSNILALGTWAGWLVLPFNKHATFLFLILVYIGIRWIEHAFLSAQLTPQYHQLRQRLTLIVVSCHLLLWIL